MSALNDPLNQAIRFAFQNGICIDAEWLAASPEEAGTLDIPDRRVGDIDVVGEVACDLVIQEWWQSYTLLVQHLDTEAKVALRLRMVCRIASMLLPAVVIDYDRRWALTLDDEGRLPLRNWHQDTHTLVGRVTDYLAEHDRGEWVDPYAIAGAVADLHDHTRAWETYLALTGVSGAAVS